MRLRKDENVRQQQKQQQHHHQQQHKREFIRIFPHDNKNKRGKKDHHLNKMKRK